MLPFQTHGYFIDHYVKNGLGLKYIGHTILEELNEDRMLGYRGRETFIADNDIQLNRGRMIKSGETVTTELQLFCGKRLRLSNAR